MTNHFRKYLRQIKPSRRRLVINFLLTLIVGIIIYGLVTIFFPSASVSKPYRTSWIGNTFGGDKWVQNFIEAMYVMPDGTVYTNSIWDEAGRQAGIYKNGDAIGMLKELHGWGRGGGVAIAANDKYVYAAMTQGNEGGGLIGSAYPPKGIDWYCVRRYNLKGQPAPFRGGRGHDRSMLIVSTSSPVTGLATAGNELYVSDGVANQIRVYSTRSMRQLRNWSFARPGQITVDRQGNLWIIQAKDGSNKPKILQYSKAGKQLSAITDVVEPTALAIDNQGRLMVTENGPRQQVLTYNIAPQPKLVGTFGTKGGIYSGTRGQIGNLKFYGLTGAGTDSAGSIYVSSNGFRGSGSDLSGTDLRKFSAKGALQWQLLGLPFVDNADADPATDAVDVFTKHEHYVMDYSKGTGKEWTYKAYILDPFRYPHDPRLHNIRHATASVFVRRIEGKRFLFITGQLPESLSIYRFDGEIAVPCGAFARQPVPGWPVAQPKARWLWRDRNGDGYIQTKEYEILGAVDDLTWGWEIDSNGDIWQASEAGVIRHYRYQGLDRYGSPIYTSTAMEELPMPAPFNKLERIKYFPATDVMYLAGYTVERPQKGQEWGIVGTEIVRYDNWSKQKKMRWRVPLTYVPAADPINSRMIKAMDIAGDKVFAVTFKTAEVYVYNANTGAQERKLTPGPEVARESGWIDIPYALRAYRRKNGEYLVFVEEDLKAKVIMYRFR